MDAGFIDLDIMLTRIRDVQSKVYFLEAVKAYKAGALRASLVSAWVALVYDLIAKHRKLSDLGDNAATEFIESWDVATAANNTKQLLELERKMVDDTMINTQVVNKIAHTHLKRIREDRHLCAHPAFSAEAKLFEPSPELVRLHLFNAVDLVLSQEPLQGKAIFELFDADVKSAGFPTKYAQILDYVEQRYLKSIRPQNIRNFGTVLAKSLLKGEPSKWEPQHGNIISSLVAVRDRAAQAWPDVSQTIIELIDNLEPENRPRAIAFLGTFPEFWNRLKKSTQTALKETVKNATPDTLTDYRILAGVSLPQFRQALLNVIAGLNSTRLAGAIAEQPLNDLWPRAVELYEGSRSFRGSEGNFRDLIAPFAGRLDSQQHDQLLDAVIENGQNWDASGTESLLLGVLSDAIPMNRPGHGARNRFYRHVHRIRNLKEYEHVLAFLQTDGWALPPPQDDDE